MGESVNVALAPKADIRLQRDIGRYGSWSCKNALREGRFSGVGEGHGMSGFDYALIAAMSGRMPMMFITRVRL